MSPSRLVPMLILPLGFAVSGTGWTPRTESQAAQPPGNAQVQAPQAGWVKDRLAVVDKKLDAEVHDLILLYQHLHANPELSLMEVKTAARLAEEMRKIGCDVTEKVGGNGIVAVLKNGPGPVVLGRVDVLSVGGVRS